MGVSREAPPIAYLCSRYPALSHAFVLREVRALRARSLSLETFSIRPADPAELISQADREEAGTTSTILPTSATRLLAAHLLALLRAPGAYASTLLLALRLRPPGFRGLLWQLFYFAEAILLWRECLRRQIAHVHVHFANVAADVALLATRFGRHGGGPRTWSFTMHGPTELYDIEAHRLPAKVRDAAFVACISDFARSQLMSLVEPSVWERLHVVRCGVDPTVLEPGEKSGDEEGGRLNVLCVAQLSARKGHAILLEAIADLAASGTELEVTIAGDGPERAALERRSHSLGLDGRVRFAGAVGGDEVLALNRRADIFCLPSFGEGVPVVLMEAMALGVPVITTRIMGVPELIEDGVSGLLVSPGRSDELAEALRRLADDPALRAELALGGRKQILRSYDLRDSAARLDALFAGVDT